MELSYTESYSYNSNLIRNHLTNPQLETSISSSFLHLLKILEKDVEKEGAPIENYDFAGNLPLIINYLYKVKSHNSNIYQELIKLLQVGLSDLARKCRELQQIVTEQEKIKGLGDIAPLIVDTSLYEIDNLNVNATKTMSNDKSEVTIVHDKKKNYYAIKRFKRNIENSNKQKSLLNNVLLYSQLKHYSIAPFVGINLYYRTEGRFFYPSIVTKYQKKKSLFDVVFKTNDRFIFNDTQKMILLLGVSSALKYLHKNEITHGNLKPSNILLNSKFEPFVSDFFNSHLDLKDPTSVAFIAPEILNYDSSKQAATTTAALTKTIAKNVQTLTNTTTKSAKSTKSEAKITPNASASSTARLTSTTASLATNASTEKKKPSKYTKEADVYSFGMVAFSILSSQAPFATESLQPKNVIKMINEGKRPQIPFYVPNNFVSLIERCWQKEPSNRPTMKEIVDFICETEPLPETSIKEFGEYTKKVRPNYIMPSLYQLKEKEKQQQQTLQQPTSRLSNSSLSEHKESARQSGAQSKSGESGAGKDQNKEKPKESARSKESTKKFNSNSDFEPLSEPIDLDDPEAVYQYAMKIRPKSIPQSNNYLKKCAEMGHTRGQVEYGKVLLDESPNEVELSRAGLSPEDEDLKLNEILAAHYFKSAASRDDPEALYLYGRCLYYGIGVKHDYTKAAKYLERSAYKGNQDGQYLFALCLEEGNGVPQNIPLAIKFFKKAEKNDVVSASRHLIRLGASS